MHFKIRNIKLYLWILPIIISVMDSKAQQFEDVRSYITYKTQNTIEIDGVASEISWKKAPWTEYFTDIEGVEKPAYDTRIKMLWDEDFLYFYAEMEEPHVWGTLKNRDTVIFYNNDFEIFIDPDGDTHNYYELEVNALNTVWDLFIVKPYREPAPIVDNWDIKGLKSAVDIKGTLNDPEDIDDSWSVEIAIPWGALVEANVHNKLPVNEYWRINFSRVNWDYQLDQKNTYSRKKNEKGEYFPEYNWVWSPQGVINMHEPERWGYVYFSPKTVGKTDFFQIPDSERVKWYLYDLYRTQKAYYSEHGKWILTTEDLLKKNPLEESWPEPELEFHKTGWNISIKIPETNKTYVLTQDGDFKSLP